MVVIRLIDRRWTAQSMASETKSPAWMTKRRISANIQQTLTAIRVNAIGFKVAGLSRMIREVGSEKECGRTQSCQNHRSLRKEDWMNAVWWAAFGGF